MPDVFISYSRELESDLVDRLAAALGERGQDHLWDLGTDQQLGSSLYTGSIGFGLGFSPDGAYLATAGENGPTVLWPSLLWNTDFGALRSNLCRRLGENLDPTQWKQYVPNQNFQTVCAGYPQES